MKKVMKNIFKSFNRRLIDSQIEVYLAWTRKNQRWDLGSDQEWLELFAEVANLYDIQDATTRSMDVYTRYIQDRYGQGYLSTSSQKSVSRFIRFYSARTKGFTNSPRYVILSKDINLSTTTSGLL